MFKFGYCGGRRTPGQSKETQLDCDCALPPGPSPLNPPEEDVVEGVIVGEGWMMMVWPSSPEGFSLANCRRVYIYTCVYIYMCNMYIYNRYMYVCVYLYMYGFWIRSYYYGSGYTDTLHIWVLCVLGPLACCVFYFAAGPLH